MTYNVENLFDDIDNGTEYSDYDPGEGAWSTESFHAKLANISEVLRTAGSNGVDIIALQEVESAHALDLLKDSYLNGMGYRYAVISPDEGAAVRVSFLSRLPLQDVRTHRVQVKGEYPSRSLLEVRVEFHGHSLVLINCHWKSKSGGARKTEEQRLAASELIVLRLKELFREDPGVNVIILGDLNENPDEFLQIQKSYQTALLPNEDDIPLEYAKRSLFVTTDPIECLVDDDRVILYSPWEEADSPGSYVYQDNWERIDHFLLSPGFLDPEGLRFSDFEVMAESFMVDNRGYPLRWNRDWAGGYSDHLPLLARFGR